MSTEEKKNERQEYTTAPTPQDTGSDANSTENPAATVLYESVANGAQTQKKKLNKRTIIEIVAGIIVLFILIGSMGGPSQDEYDKLQKKYDEQTVELETVNTHLESVSNEYSAYQ